MNGWTSKPPPTARSPASPPAYEIRGEPHGEPDADVTKVVWLPNADPLTKDSGTVPLHPDHFVVSRANAVSSV